MTEPRSLPHTTNPANAPEGVVVRHLDWMRVRNLSPLTITGRRSALRRLSAHLGGPVLYATADELKGWQAARSRVLSPATRRTELSHVREFYRWTVDEGFRTDDPTARLPMPRAPRRVPRPIDDRALADVLARADAPTAAILGLAAFAGLRACEVARLDWSEITTRGDVPLLHVACGKGGRSRTIPLSPALITLLEALPHRRGPVILRADGGAGYTTANAITKRASRHLHELNHPETLHMLRHRFATAAYRAVRDIRAVQEALGHASPTTTSIYAAAAVGVAREAVMGAGVLAA